MKKFIVIFILILLPFAAHAADPLLEQPHWSLEVKGGLFIPDIDNWKQYYGKRNTGHFASTLAYKIFRQLEVGIEGGYIRDKGQGYARLHNEPAGEVTYELFPIEAFVLVRGVFSEKQWLVPYIGGGWTRMYYREKIKYQESVKGSTDGSHARAGLQFLLDELDPSAATSFYLDYGVFHTYFFLEARYSRAMIDTVDGERINLGGTSFLAGLLFEF